MGDPHREKIEAEIEKLKAEAKIADADMKIDIENKISELQSKI